jgi:hypothetical protein
MRPGSRLVAACPINRPPARAPRPEQDRSSTPQKQGLPQRPRIPFGCVAVTGSARPQARRFVPSHRLQVHPLLLARRKPIPVTRHQRLLMRHAIGCPQPVADRPFANRGLRIGLALCFDQACAADDRRNEKPRRKPGLQCSLPLRLQPERRASHQHHARPGPHQRRNPDFRPAYLRASPHRHGIRLRHNVQQRAPHPLAPEPAPERPPAHVQRDSEVFGSVCGAPRPRRQPQAKGAPPSAQALLRPRTPNRCRARFAPRPLDLAGPSP